MDDFIGGTAINVAIPLMRGDFPIIPTVGTVTYTIFDHTGTPMVGFIDLPLTTEVTTHTLVVPIPADATVIDAAKRFERRTIMVNYLSSNHPQRFTAPIRLIPFLNHSVTPDGVRQFLGLNKNELPDADVDLTAAYLNVENDFSPSVLADLLSTGTIVELAANEAIRMNAVIEMIPSMRQRVAQMESNGIHQFKRVEIKDFDKLERMAWDRYAAARTTATGVEEDAFSFVVLTTDTDAITGE